MTVIVARLGPQVKTLLVERGKFSACLLRLAVRKPFKKRIYRGGRGSILTHRSDSAVDVVLDRPKAPLKLFHG